MNETLLDFARTALGPCSLTDDHTWYHQASVVLKVRDANGTDWILKNHRDRNRYETERDAYRTWVPALAGHAARLHTYDDDLQTVILTAVPGTPIPTRSAPSPETHATEQHLHREAGTLLRRFHDAQPPLPWPDLGPAKLEEFEQLASQAATLLTPSELGFVHAQVQVLTEAPPQNRVPCHRDYTPRNWLTDPDGHRLYIVDFEYARLDLWHNDLVRLANGTWTARPDLREAFLDGYGRHLDDSDRAILRACTALTSTWLTVKGHEYGSTLLRDASRQSIRDLMNDTDTDGSSTT